MQITTELSTAALKDVFDRFEELVGQKTWCRVARERREELKRNRYLEEYFHQEYSDAFALERISERKKKNLDYAVSVNTASEYQVFTLMTQFLNLYSAAAQPTKKALLGQIKAAFSKTNDLRALDLELAIATHISRKMGSVDFPELTGAGTFDLLAKHGGVELEIECKSISHDKGRQVHRKVALEIHHAVHKEVRGKVANLRTGLFVGVTFEERAPTDARQQGLIAQEVSKAITLGGIQKSSLCEVRVESFDITSTPFETKLDMDEARAFIEGNFGFRNRELMITGQSGVNAFVLALRSSKPDQFLDSVYRTLKDAASRQLTLSRPGLICARFEDLTAAQLNSIADDAQRGQRNRLERIATDLFQSDERKHLASVAFLTQGEVAAINSSAISKSGPAYVFYNTNGAWGSDPRLRWFSI